MGRSGWPRVCRSWRSAGTLLSGKTRGRCGAHGISCVHMRVQGLLWGFWRGQRGWRGAFTTGLVVVALGRDRL